MIEHRRLVSSGRVEVRAHPGRGRDPPKTTGSCAGTQKPVSNLRHTCIRDIPNPTLPHGAPEDNNVVDDKVNRAFSDAG